MKWIKIYDSYFDKNINNLFEIINHQQFDDFIKSHKRCHISENDRVLLQNLFKMRLNDECEIGRIYLSNNFDNLSPIEIYKFEDDWWIMILTRKSIPGGHLIPIILFDTMEGIEFFTKSIVEVDKFPYFKIL